MGKQSLEKERNRKSAEQELTRRSFIRNLTIAIGLGALGYGGERLYEAVHSPSYVEAYDNPNLQQRWLDSLKGRPYVTKKITTDADRAELKRRFDYEVREGIIADTVYNQDLPVGEGCTSTLYVHPEAFDYNVRDFKREQGVIVTNIIENHELIHADHYHHGIEGFPISWFKAEDSKINVSLFLAVSELKGYHSEFLGLEGKADSRFVAFYRSQLSVLAKPYWDNLQKLTNNQQLLGQARRDCWWLQGD